MNLRAKLILGSLFVIMITIAISTLGVSYLVKKQNDEYSRNLVMKAVHFTQMTLDDLRNTSLERVSDFTANPVNIINMSYLLEMKAKKNIDEYKFILERPKEDMTASLLEILFAGGFDGFTVYDGTGDIIIFLKRNGAVVEAGFISTNNAGRQIIKYSTAKERGGLNHRWSERPFKPGSDSRYGLPLPLSPVSQFGIVKDTPALSGVVPFSHKDVYVEGKKTLGCVVYWKNLDQAFAEDLKKKTEMEVNIFTGKTMRSGTLARFIELPEGLLSRQELRSPGKTDIATQVRVNRVGEKEYYQAAIPFYHEKGSGAISLSLSRDDTIRKTYENTVMLIFIMGVCMLIVVPVALFMSGRFSNRIKDILSVVNEITGGNLATRIRVASGDELGTLAVAFNKMAEDLQEHVDKLKKTGEKYRRLFDIMPSMLIYVERNGTIVQWNTAAEKFTGIPASQAVGGMLWDMYPYFKRYQEYFDAVMRTNAPGVILRETYLRDVKKYLNISIYPVAFDGSEGAVIRVDDVTETEKKDEQLRQAQKMETIGTLAGGIAHDFNNVLGGIIGRISLMKYALKEKQEVDAERLEHDLDILDRTSARAAQMVQQLLVLSRKRELSISSLDLNSAIRHVIEICENTFDKSIQLIPVYYKDRAIVAADPVQIEQVLLNLCVNARDAMTIMRKENEPYGGTLRVSLERFFADRLFCAHHPEATESYYWILEVSDTGTGMDPETLSNIFDPFFTTKEKGKGVGLGLSMAYNIVNQHNGFITVYSNPGGGSTFRVFLPAAEDAGLGEEIADRKKDLPMSTGLILVVDDEEIIRQTAQAMLEECGYTVILAGNGEEAIETFKNRCNEIKVVLLDMVMPKKSGKETYIEMKKINPDIKVLLSSGFKQDDRVQSILELGIQGFIQKPYSLERLAGAIKELTEAG